MKRNVKNKWIVLLLAILSLFILGGCSMGESLEEALAVRGLTAQVTYYANGGAFENSTVEKNMYYKTDSKALNIGIVAPTSGSVGISRMNYELIGWYHVTEVLDEEKGLCELGDEVDFSKALKEGEHWVIAAKWRAMEGLRVVMVCDEDATVQVGKNVNVGENVTSFKNGDVIGEIEYDSKDSISSAATPDTRLFKVKDSAYTFFAYYTDEACTQEVSFPIKRGETQMSVYAKYIKGNWTFVKTALEVSTMFSSLSNGNNKMYWIREDIDCSSLTSVNAISSFAGTIHGDGHTLKNLTVNKTLEAGTPRFALFGDIQATAKLTDLTFENLSINCTIKTAFSANIYLVFLTKSEQAEISNVTLNATLKISGANGSEVSNMKDENGNKIYTNCLFGGYDTDEAYKTETAGTEFIVNGAPEDIIQ